jgi:hypothetical protein
MSDQANRRRFLLGATSTGVALGVHNFSSLLPAVNAEESSEYQRSTRRQQESGMVDFDYLAKGLYAMARAHQVNTMAGHLGAAVVAGYFIAEQHPDLDEGVYKGIEGELDRIIAGQSAFGPGKNASISVAEMFESFPKERSNENLIDGIADALAKNIHQTRQSGHNVIFAAIAIRALKDHPDFATPSVTDGIRKLIAGFNGQTPGNGYYGKEKGRIDGRKVPLPKDDALPPHADLQAMANAVLDDLIQHASERRVGFGGLTHVINHAAALAELARHGYRELAMKGLPAHHQHMQLWRTLPNVAGEPGERIPTKQRHDPRTSAFWQSGKLSRESAKLTHRVKTLYGFDALVELIKNQPKRKEGNVNLRYLM